MHTFCLHCSQLIPKWKENNRRPVESLPQSLGLVDKRPLLHLRQQFPFRAQSLWNFAVVHLGVLDCHFPPLTATPHHKRVHRSLNVRWVVIHAACMRLLWREGGHFSSRYFRYFEGLYRFEKFQDYVFRVSLSVRSPIAPSTKYLFYSFYLLYSHHFLQAQDNSSARGISINAFTSNTEHDMIWKAVLW